MMLFESLRVMSENQLNSFDKFCESFQDDEVHHNSRESSESKNNYSNSKRSKKYEFQRPEFVLGKRRKNNNGVSDSIKSEHKSQRSLADNHQTSLSKLSAKTRVFQPFVRDLIRKQPFLNQTQIKNMIKEDLDLTISQQTVSKILDCIGYTKKRRMNTNIEGNTEQNKNLRYQYAKIYQNQLNQRQLLFIDQIGFSEIIERQFGYAPIGQPLVRQKRSLKKEVVTLSVVMGYERLHYWSCLEGPPKPSDIASMFQNFGDNFKEWFLILDNAAIHKSYEIRQVCTRKNIKILYLPPNSSQLNPVQLLFGQLKHVYRSMKFPVITSIQQMIMRTNECCKKLQSQKFWTYKAQITYWIEKALERKNFFNVD